MDELNSALQNIKDTEKRSFSGIIYELESVITKTQKMGYSLNDILSKLQEKMPDLKLKSLNQSLFLARKPNKNNQHIKPIKNPEKINSEKKITTEKIDIKSANNIGTDEARKKQQEMAKNILNKHK